MANAEHVSKLQEGLPTWYAWRLENLAVIPDLSEADLSGAYLRGAKLHSASLQRAHLAQAWLSLADLNHADLADANLNEVALIGADLRGANLERADLRQADLRQADLSGANLSGAMLGLTNFVHTNLTGTVGLASCSHFGESFVDYYTLSKSGPLPLEFLRGCGLPDQYIDYLPSLLNQAIQFYSCFISYSRRDSEFAERIYSDLQSKNIRCWYAPEDLKIGDAFQERIEESIRLHDKLLVVLSEASLNSPWVELEIQSAREREDRTGKLVLFPIRVDHAVINATRAWVADLRRSRYIGDFTNWKDHDSYQLAFERLLRDLKADIGGSR